jgi:murein DD-endopeptidase MepM/ murein hydrolase activator NlpD
MVPPSIPRPAWAILLPALALLAAGCFGGSSDAAPKPDAADGSDGIVIATLTPAAQTQAAESTAEPSDSPAPTEAAAPAETPTPEPPSAVPTGLAFQPPQVRQGGYSVIYLYEPAVNATLSFGGLQYPMLQDGDRWWAVIGVGAFAEPGLAPLSVSYTPPDGGDVESIAQSIEIVDYDYPVENIDLSPETSALLDPDIVNNELAIRAGVLSGFTSEKLWSGAFVRPAEGAISSIYGVARSYNNGPVSSYHHGTDFAGDVGDPVYAAAGGVVVFAQELQVRGNTIMIDHGAGLFTAYNHLSAIGVQEGETVTAGQLIGAIGSTGLVTGPHLHWEVVLRGVEVDGELWLEGTPIGP